MYNLKYIIGIAATCLCLNLRAQIIDTVCTGEKNIHYYVIQNPGATYQWEIEGGTIVSGNGTNNIQVDWDSIPGIFELSVIAKNQLGCESPIQIGYVLIIQQNPKISKPPREEHIFPPNAFSPNGDGLNETYKPVTLGIETYSLRILNRWGETLFESTNPDIGWDGTYRGAGVEADIYLYFIEAQGYSGKWYYLKGNVQLLR